MTTQRIDHSTHDHPNTKRARALCRAGRRADHTPPPATLELVWRPSPDVERVVAEIPLADLEAALAGRP